MNVRDVSGVVTRVESSAPVVRPTSSAPIHVAVVEDEWIWASGVQFQLERASGIDFAGSASAVADALDLIERERPDVVLLDLMLGTESALPVARTVAQRRLDARIVVVTAEPSPWALAEAESCGVRGFEIGRAHV